MLKRAIVVGASSGIGAALTRRLVAGGYRVAAVARRVERLEALCRALSDDGPPRALPFVHDVRDRGAAPELFTQMVGALDGLDLLVYAAGVMPRVPHDQFDTSVDAHIFEVNTLGAVSWLNLGAERFRVQGSGTLVGIGSVAGDRGRRGNPAYGASKAALHTFLESLRNRLSQHGVTVITVKPGPVHTEMTQGMDRLPMVIEADVAADRIAAAIAGRRSTVYVPARWRPVMAVIRAIPSVVFRRMSL